MKEDFRYTGNLVVSDDLLALYSEDDLRLTNYFKNTTATRPDLLTNSIVSIHLLSGLKILLRLCQRLAYFGSLSESC